jgi:hypothetical protein
MDEDNHLAASSTHAAEGSGAAMDGNSRGICHEG